MTMLEDRPEAGSRPAEEPDAPAVEEKAVLDAGDAAAARPVDALLTGAATFLAVAAAGWMCAGVFRGSFARVVALVGAFIGVGLATLSMRSKRPTLIQCLTIPVASVVGAILVLPDAQGGTANLPSLVAEAVRSGGIAQPPVPFDPGWRFIIVVLLAIIGLAAAGVAAATNKPKLGIALPAPLLFGAAFVQPPQATFLSSFGAFVLMVSAFGVAYGADLAKDGTTSGQFELRRFGRGAALLGVIALVLVALSRAGFLFPEPADQKVVPPMRPERPPPSPDRVMFTVKAPRVLPLHLGVLDVYRDVAWLTPPYDASRMQEVGPDGALIAGAEPGEAPPLPPLEPAGNVAVTFTINDVQGHVLPTLASGQRVTRDGFALEYNPRTQEIRLPDERAQKGMTYTVEARPSPGAPQLQAAGPPPAVVGEYLSVPTAPPEVAELLSRAPAEPLFDRLQFIRNEYYSKVIASGAGDPIDVPPQRVVEMLAEQPATPYEITAGEVLLARWAGVPARLGYGFYGGEPKGDLLEIRPKHGATWLEAFFSGHGWVPIIGTPPRAQSSITPSDKNEDPAVRPTEELALVVQVPIELESITLLYSIVRYWAVRALPYIVATVLLLAFYPGLLKLVRRRRRRAWAQRGSLRDRIAVAYAEMRDAMTDLNIGTPTNTPLQFLKAVAPDPEHTDLAWLVTRATWGDLARNVRPQDAEAAEDMAQSVLRRVRRASPFANRVVAFGSRVSLRDPHIPALPNVWTTARPGRWVVGRLKRLSASVRPSRWRRVVPKTAAALAAALFLSGCFAPSQGGSDGATPSFDLPTELPGVIGIRLQPEPTAEAVFAEAGPASLVNDGRVFSIREGDLIQGSLQVGVFKPRLAGRAREVREGLLESMGGGRFTLSRIGDERIYESRLPEQRLLLWVPPNARYYVMMVARQGFDRADATFVALLAHQRGERPGTLVDVSRQPLDPRRTLGA